jgi:competence protein ComEC
LGPLQSYENKPTIRFVLRVSKRQDMALRSWQPASGQVQVTLLATAMDFTVGDEIEILGRLALPGEAMNPGEFDYAAYLRDQRITATLTVLESDEVVLMRRGWPTSLFGWLAVIRGWAQRTLDAHLGSQKGVAAALLLGESSAMSGDDWEKYFCTGVIHVLAISGQHLVVLAAFLWFAARALHIRRRRAAIVVALILIGYALLTGARPAVMRAAWVVGIYCLGILLQRPVAHANAFALGWIGVALFNPTDIFNAGCQLSFLAVIVLVWGIGRWAETPMDPLERLIDEARSWPSFAVVWVLRWLTLAYAVNVLIWCAVSPLVAWHFHMLSPVALLIGPLMVVLTSIALLTGFAFLMFAGWCLPVAVVFAWATQACLRYCEAIVTWSEQAPFAFCYAADLPAWWLWAFYLALLGCVWLPLRGRAARCAIGGGAVWLGLGVALQLMPNRPGEFRCTFVAVGHGGCTVLETANGKVIVYDAGATNGPDLTRRYIAPYLWSRGIRRIDWLILSHADLDHFNGVPQLVDRFSVGKVMSTPTFSERPISGMQKTLESLATRGLAVEVVSAGDRWDFDGVKLTVLHPPKVGPAGKENARSLVLHIEHGDWSMLLTGDLEEAGLDMVLGMKPPRIDVLMAPHHGSDTSNVPALARWAKPKLVVSCQATPTSERKSVRMYEQAGATYLGTWPHGCITIRPANQEAPVETYRSQLKLRPF